MWILKLLNGCPYCLFWDIFYWEYGIVYTEEAHRERVGAPKQPVASFLPKRSAGHIPYLPLAGLSLPPKHAAAAADKPAA